MVLKEVKQVRKKVSPMIEEKESLELENIGDREEVKNGDCGGSKKKQTKNGQF